jgi:beta-galactosidase
MDLARGRVRVSNRYDFLGFGGLSLGWRLVEDGVVVQSGSVPGPLDVPAGQGREMVLPYDVTRIRPGHEGLVELSLTLRADEPWAPRGHEVAWEQLTLPRAAPARPGAVPRGLPLDVTSTGPRTVVTGRDFDAGFEGAGLVSYRWRGEERLAGPLGANLWRVPTDNDEGGGRAGYASRWREAGLDRLKASAREPRVETLDGGRVRVTLESRLQAAAAAVLVTTVYDVGGDGEIAVSATFRQEGTLPPLPRVGVQVQLPGRLDAAEWYGRGPHESYADRKEGARLGVYRAKVEDLHFPFVMAQENGSHTDVRWVSLTDASGRGLRFSGDPTLAFTAHDYTDAALTASKTSQRLARDGRVTLSLDLAQMGLGGDDSWSPRVHPEYLLTAPEFRFAFRIRAVQ